MIDGTTPCGGCGQKLDNHFSAIVGITQSPFDVLKTQTVMVCPTATFSVKKETPALVKATPKRPAKKK